MKIFELLLSGREDIQVIPQCFNGADMMETEMVLLPWRPQVTNMLELEKELSVMCSLAWMKSYDKSAAQALQHFGYDLQWN